MERTKQKSKKDKPNKYVDKEKPPSFIADVKTLKENLKIREILRTVKMNSSMRIKAPRGSKVMQNKDFTETEDIFEDSTAAESGISEEPTCATNLDVVTNSDSKEQDEVNEVVSAKNIEQSNIEITEAILSDITNADNTLQQSKSLSEGLEKAGESEPDTEVYLPNTPPVIELLRSRERKLSLDHTMLSRREGLSQSDLDLNLIGKSPLERKSSFFRKKLDSFLKNTTEIFKRQTLNNKGSQTLPRRGSNCSRMSVSLHSLNENASYNDEHEYEALDKYTEKESKGSTTSVVSSATPVGSNSSISINQSERTPLEQSRENNFTGSQTALNNNKTSKSINSLNEAYTQDSLLNSRAISMSSGLDTAHGPRKRKTSRSNRVTWLASDSLADYFRRMIQDEKVKEMEVSHSYQDFSTIPENYVRTDSKGRRLSYQRAVSGEDPFLPPKFMDNSFRRKKIVEYPEGNNEVSATLAEFTRKGVPPLVGFTIRSIPDDAVAYLLWAESETLLEDHYDWKKLSPVEEARQAVIKELLHTEADHIRHLMTIVEVYIAAAHALQDVDKLLDLDTSRLFLNIPDVLNANMMFWELVMYPMVADSFKNRTTFNPDLMAPGFTRFSEIFEPYEDYVCDQSKAVDYLRALSSNAEFMTYLTWCHSQNTANRLQLADILVKPMQRLTKYSLILRRIITYTETEESKALLDAMEATAVSFVHRVNRAIRQREEIEKIDDLEKVLDAYEVDFKDEDMDRYFHLLNDPNLRAPMVNCGPENSRAIIYQGDLRFKDHLKEVEARVILFTDMLVVCKKLTKGGPYSYKMIRPKYMLERTVPFARFSSRNNPHEVTGLIYVVVDEHGSAYTAFCLSEPAKDPNPQQTLRIWDQKIREARLSYELSVWFYRNPVRDLSEVEADYSSELYRANPEEYIIERRARERVAAMMHPNRRASTCQEVTTMRSDSFDPSRGPPSLRHPLHRTSTGGSSRNSRLSSFHQSTSAASHDEPPNALKYLYRAGSSVEHLIPPQNPDDVARSITVNVVSESECETVVPSRQPTPPMVVLQQSSPRHVAGGSSASVTTIGASGSGAGQGARCSSAGAAAAAGPVASTSHTTNTLRVSPHHPLTLVHSLPDLSVTEEYNHPKPPMPRAPSPQSASEKLYQSHQELLLRNRLAASHHHQYLSPDHRGTSYPPPSPNRASLKRGLAFSYSFKNPPLSKMGHVNSQSQVDHASAHARDQPSTSGTSEKGEKRKQLMGRSKVSGKSHSPERGSAGAASSRHQLEHEEDSHRQQPGPSRTTTTTTDNDNKARKTDKTNTNKPDKSEKTNTNKPDKSDKKGKGDKHSKHDKGKSE